MTKSIEKVKVEERKTTEGRRVISLKKSGSKKVDRLDHNSPSYMRSEE